MSDKVFISYSEYGNLLNCLVDKLKDVKGLKYIYGIPKGGLPIAVHLAHHLDLRLVETNEVYERDKEEILIVDDIVDTGETMSRFKDVDSHYPMVASLFYKTESEIVPDYYAKSIGHIWIVFPWEKSDEKPNRSGY